MRNSKDLHERMAGGDVRAGGSDRTFGAVFTVASLALAGWLLLKDVSAAGMPAAIFAAAAAVFFLAATLMRPGLLSPLNRAWTALGLVLHKITNPILLAIVFFGVIMPIGLAMRLAGKDTLGLRGDRTARSYWRERHPPGPSPDSMTQQF